MRYRKATDRPRRDAGTGAPRRPVRGSLLALLTFGLAFAPLHAQELPEGDGVRIGQTRLYPELRLDYFAYDNVFRAGRDETEASSVRVSPEVRWRAERRLLELEGRYSGRYSAGSEDILDFAEHELGVNVDVSPSSRTDVDAYASYRRFGEELRLRPPEGTPIGPEVSERVDADTFAVGASLGYGAEGARGNIRFGIDVDGYDPDADTARFVLNRNQFTRVEPYTRFSLRVSPDTRLLFEARFADVDRRAEGSIDSSSISLLTGLGFATSGAFGGDVRVGLARISYDRDVLDEDNTARVLGSLFFQPTTFSRFVLGLSRDFDPRLGDTALGTATAISSAVSLAWRYGYSDRVFHDATLRVEDNESVENDESGECLLAANRDVDVGFELNVRVRRWIELGAGVRHEIDRIEDCGAADPAAFDVDATRLGAHVRVLL